MFFFDIHSMQNLIYLNISFILVSLEIKILKLYSENKITPKNQNLFLNYNNQSKI